MQIAEYRCGMGTGLGLEMDQGLGLGSWPGLGRWELRFYFAVVLHNSSQFYAFHIAEVEWLNYGHFAYRTHHLQDTSPIGQFAYCLVMSPTGHFTYETFCLQDTSPTGHFAYWTVRLLFGHVAYWTLCLLVISLTRHFAYRTLHLQRISPTGHFVYDLDILTTSFKYVMLFSKPICLHCCKTLITPLWTVSK